MKILFFVLVALAISSCSIIDPSPQNDQKKDDDQTFVPLSPGVQTITGIVISGGDQTPDGLLGGPREYHFRVELDHGEIIELSYTAFPPSPSMIEEPRPLLMFNSGALEPGDKINARGTYDSDTKTLTVEAEEDFIIVINN